MPASPCAAEFYEIWHTRSTHRCNHVFQIFSRSFQWLRIFDTPKLPFPIDLLRRPYNSVAVLCDTVIEIRQEPLFTSGGLGLGLVSLVLALRICSCLHH